ncbi:MAG: TerB family tellurite resistance protein [Cyclobacteriaceae bacterium]
MKKELLDSHLKNLWEVAMSDGHIDESETKLLYQIANRHGAGKSRANKIKGRMDSIEFVSPDNDEERFDQIYDLVMMMAADGEIDDNEMAVCNKYAEKLGFDKRIVEEMVYSISSNITVGNDPEETKQRIKYMLKLDEKQ